MSILDTHLTDAEISRFAQANMDELLQKAGGGINVTVNARTFFLNPAALNATQGGDKSMERGIIAKLGSLLPPQLLSMMRGNVARMFLGLGYLAYQDRRGSLQIVLSRPDDASTLKERLHNRTGIKVEDLVASDSVCGYDNLEMLGRVYQIFNSIPNGGAERLKAMGAYGLMQYRSTLGARRSFMAFGGTTEAIALHAATSHIGAFARGKIPYEYVGFLGDFGLKDQAVEIAYKGILESLVKKGYAEKEPRGHMTAYKSMSVEKLVAGMTDLLDEYANKMDADNGAKFGAFHKAVTVPERLIDDGRKALKGLKPEELIELTQYFIVYSTLKGLKTLMGDNMLKYAPQKGLNSLERTNRFLALQLQ